MEIGSSRCLSCGGTGRKTSPAIFGLGMIQQACKDCGGSGGGSTDEDRCTVCEGNQVIQEKKVLQIHIEKGMKDGQKIIFQEQANEKPNCATGDVIFVLELKDHPRFRRNHNDLFTDYSINLTEALCGFQFALTHLDGRQLLIGSNLGEVIKPGQCKVINDKGMPCYRAPLIKGHLYIRFKVEFPAAGAFSTAQCLRLATILPPILGQPPKDELDKLNEIILSDVIIEEEIRRQYETSGSLDSGSNTTARVEDGLRSEVILDLVEGGLDLLSSKDNTEESPLDGK